MFLAVGGVRERRLNPMIDITTEFRSRPDPPLTQRLKEASSENKEQKYPTSATTPSSTTPI
jgi:hypothetical protein